MAAVSKLSVQVGEIAITITMGAPSLDLAVLVKIEVAAKKVEDDKEKEAAQKKEQDAAAEKKKEDKKKAAEKKEELHSCASQLRDINMARVASESCKRTNTRKCGRCGEIGHYKNTCPLLVGFPQKKTSTWNSTHKEYASTKYTCEFCGKKEMNKCNLDRHKKNHHPIRLSVAE